MGDVALKVAEKMIVKDTWGSARWNHSGCNRRIKN